MCKYFFWSFNRVCVVAKALSPNFGIVFWWKIQRGLTQKPANCMKIRGIVRVHQTQETYRVGEFKLYISKWMKHHLVFCFISWSTN